MKTIVYDVVLCCECKHYCPLNGAVALMGGGMCLVDAPSHISMVAPEHFCSFGVEKDPCEKAEDSS